MRDTRAATASAIASIRLAVPAVSHSVASFSGPVALIGGPVALVGGLVALIGGPVTLIARAVGDMCPGRGEFTRRPGLVAGRFGSLSRAIRLVPELRLPIALV